MKIKVKEELETISKKASEIEVTRRRKIRQRKGMKQN